jgi:hypothetical protein
MSQHTSLGPILHQVIQKLTYGKTAIELGSFFPHNRSATDVLNDGEWHHYVGTRSNGMCVDYIDGKKVS